MNRRRLIGASLLAISVVALVTYFTTLQVGFVWDDWGFIDFLITKSFPDYLIQYFDPHVQFIWYRPLYGMVWWVGYVFSGTNPAGYHFIHLLLHLGNTLLLFALTRRVSRNARVAVVAALVYVGLPRISEAVMWPADAQPEATFFYLLALWFWLAYLETGRARHFVVTLLFSALAILSKETAVTLPIMLFAADRLLVNKPATWRQLLARYAPFAILLVLYAGAMYRVLTYGLFPRQFGYKPSLQIVPNLLQYIQLFLWPWWIDIPLVLWSAGVVLLFGIALWRTQSRQFLFLGLAALIVFLPVLPSGNVIQPRYVYPAAMITMILLALCVEMILRRFRRAALRVAAPALIALVLVGDAFTIQDALVARMEVSRVDRLPFRTISQRHPTFPEDTYLYFLNGWAIYWKTMFRMRYGSTISVSDIYASRFADLSAHRNPIVVYFDSTGDPKELTWDSNSVSQRFTPPLRFDSGIQLEGYDLARARIKRGETTALILYWRATQPPSRDYTVFVHLIDANGNQIEGWDSPPRDGAAPTTSWATDGLIPDGRVLVIPSDAPMGENLRLEIGLYDLNTLQRLPILDAQGTSTRDAFSIEPIVIE